jgi:ribonucleotide reductase beta subunit family protein with ferritin-like domain
MNEFKDMFNKERKEHPSLPEKDIKTIVIDHIKEEKENEVTFAYRRLKQK